MLMLTVTGILFTVGVALFVYDFFRGRPRFLVRATPPDADRPMRTSEPSGIA